jgi:predicted DNA-binding antitoxin AbrB/MazE fold protein
VDNKLKDKDRSVENAKVTLPGTVDKIIPPILPGGTEKVQISVETDEHLYREIRIENTLEDTAGNPVTLKEGAEVHVTIEAEQKATTPKS